ncbi:MAG: DMT family transporter [Rhodospirillaceae bacterium]|jgi:drug/metabolite transporter (DMT)-like permease|nr:DMT family transporter [Rhodospirillaceae bacterium]
MEQQAKTYLGGTILALLAAFCYSLNSNFAAVSYAHGADPLSVLTTRILVGATGLYVVLRIKKVPLSLSRQDKLAAAGLGVLLALSSFLIMSSFQYIPVALAILIFYLFPLLTAVGAWILGDEPLSPIFIGLLILALIGLAFALNIGGGNLDPKGVAFALGSAFFVTLLLLFNGKLVKGRDSRPFTLVILFSCTVIFIIADLISYQFLLPNSAIGMAAYLGVAVSYSFAIILMFTGLSMIGPVRVSLFLNFEPVATIFLGFFILEQTLTPWQLFGAAIVIVAISVAGRQKLIVSERE